MEELAPALLLLGCTSDDAFGAIVRSPERLQFVNRLVGLAKLEMTKFQRYMLDLLFTA